MGNACHCAKEQGECNEDPKAMMAAIDISDGLQMTYSSSIDSSRLENKAEPTVEELGRQLLELAATNDVDLVDDVLKKGASHDARDAEGKTPLHIAAANGQLLVLKLLVGSRADLEARDGSQETPLFAAAAGGHLKVVTYLVDSGVDLRARDQTGHSTLNLAVEHLHCDVARLLVERGADLCHKLDKQCLAACAAADFERVQLLLDCGVSIDAKGEEGKTPLLIEACIGNVEGIDFAIQHGAHLEFKGDDGCTALLVAADLGHTKVVEMLLKRGADSQAQDPEGHTALLLAVDKGHAEVAALFVKQGVSGSDKQALGKRLLDACAKHEWEQAKLLLDSGANVKLKRATGHTALIMAAEQGQLDIVKALAEKGAIKESKLTNGSTPVVIAFENDKLDVAAFLANGKLTKANKEMLGKQLLEACAKNRWKKSKILISLGVNTQEKDVHGNTAFLKVCAKGNLEVAGLLMDAGADPNVQNKTKRGGLGIAAEKGHLDLVRFLTSKDIPFTNKDEVVLGPLLNKLAGQGAADQVMVLLLSGVRIDNKDEEEETPLIKACKNGHLETVGNLLDCGAPVATQGGKVPRTPLFYACKANKSDVAQLLMENAADEQDDQAGMEAYKILKMRDKVSAEGIGA